MVDFITYTGIALISSGMVAFAAMFGMAIGGHQEALVFLTSFSW